MYKTMYRMLKERTVRIYLETARRQGRLYAPLESIPPEVRDIFVTREDPGFYRHKGVQPKAIMNAFKYAVRTHKPMAGGSTITQQMVKNLYLSCDRSLLRKAREIAISLMIECRHLLTKDEILELYLNFVRYGPDVYGIADAAEYYFGKTPDALTRNQAVILAATAISPFWRRPIEAPKEFTKYRNYSLYELVAFRAMSASEAKMIAYAYSPLIGLDPELRRYRDIYGDIDAPKTSDGMAEYAKAQVGAPYWKGAYGQMATIGLLDHRPRKQVTYVCFTDYDDTIPNKEVAFDKVTLTNTFGEWISANGMKQARIAETEKYAHVTSFFNGGVEEPFEGEDRFLIPSPKVATYDLQPEMSVDEVCDTMIEKIHSGEYDVIIANFANSDMVGHTGVEKAAVEAVASIDKCIGRVVDTVEEVDGQLLICADHGNAEVMVDPETGEPMTAHTTNPVPIILVNYDPDYTLKEGGCLADIAPTLIEMMGMEKPAEMTGESLLIRK